MNIVWIIVWLIFWFGVMGSTVFLFKKYKITYYEKYWQHSIFFILSIVILLIIYKQAILPYFNQISTCNLVAFLSMIILWFVVPRFYKNDYFTKEERLQHQMPKFFEVLFQQLCFLGGLLTFGVSPIVFGVTFFIVHLPNFIFLPKKFAMFPTISSLFGGLIFSYLQSKGVSGFLFSLSLHLLSYLVFYYVLSKKVFASVVPIKR